MVKNKRTRKHTPKLDGDLDIEMDTYEPSDDSDDDYSDNEKMLLENRGRSHYDDEGESEEEVLKVHSSEEDNDNEEEEEDLVKAVGSDMDSDIEGKEENYNLPDSKAWGKRRKDFYHTDYVDEDYGGFTRAEEEEAALLEEKEARVIQDRLLAELEDTDFSFGILTQVEKKEGEKENETKDVGEEVIKTDLSKLSKREKLALLERDSPEFMGLVNDFKERLLYAKEKLYPIMELVKAKELPDCTAAEFVSTKFSVTLNYCTNIAFYLLLKAKRINIQTHPIVKRLVQYRKLLEQLDSVEIGPQIETILQMKQEGKCISIKQPPDETHSVGNSRKPEKKRKVLQLLSEKNNNDFSDVPAKLLKKCDVGKQSQKKVHFEDEPEPEYSSEQEDTDIAQNNSDDSNDFDDNDDEQEEITLPSDGKGKESNDIGKRAITFEIAKNKGLTPRRKKEQRNPRVKNRNKYRKAKIRRKGQVREPRNEISRYAGEIFGIKASVKKSIKLS